MASTQNNNNNNVLYEVDGRDITDDNNMWLHSAISSSTPPPINPNYIPPPIPIPSPRLDDDHRHSDNDNNDDNDDNVDDHPELSSSISKEDYVNFGGFFCMVFLSFIVLIYFERKLYMDIILWNHVKDATISTFEFASDNNNDKISTVNSSYVLPFPLCSSSSLNLKKDSYNHSSASSCSSSNNGNDSHDPILIHGVFHNAQVIESFRLHDNDFNIYFDKSIMRANRITEYCQWNEIYHQFFSIWNLKRMLFNKLNLTSQQQQQQQQVVQAKDADDDTLFVCEKRRPPIISKSKAVHNNNNDDDNDNPTLVFQQWIQLCSDVLCASRSVSNCMDESPKDCCEVIKQTNTDSTTTAVAGSTTTTTTTDAATYNNIAMEEKRRTQKHTNYEYRRKWTNHLIDSFLFDNFISHHNPQRDPFPSKSYDITTTSTNIIGTRNDDFKDNNIVNIQLSPLIINNSSSSSSSNCYLYASSKDMITSSKRNRFNDNHHNAIYSTEEEKLVLNENNLKSLPKETISIAGGGRGLIIPNMSANHYIYFPMDSPVAAGTTSESFQKVDDDRSTTIPSTLLRYFTKSLLDLTIILHGNNTYCSNKFDTSPPCANPGDIRVSFAQQQRLTSDAITFIGGIQQFHSLSGSTPIGNNNYHYRLVPYYYNGYYRPKTTKVKSDSYPIFIFMKGIRSIDFIITKLLNNSIQTTRYFRITSFLLIIIGFSLIVRDNTPEKIIVSTYVRVTRSSNDNFYSSIIVIIKTIIYTILLFSFELSLLWLFYYGFYDANKKSNNNLKPMRSFYFHVWVVGLGILFLIAYYVSSRSRSRDCNAKIGQRCWKHKEE